MLNRARISSVVLSTAQDTAGCEEGTSYQTPQVGRGKVQERLDVHVVRDLDSNMDSLALGGPRTTTKQTRNEKAHWKEEREKER
jgi:hypothetical protein